VNVWSADTAGRLEQWTRHFLAQSGNAFTAQRRALAMRYHDTLGQAQVLAYSDVYVVLVVLFVGLLFLIPWMRRVRADQTGPAATEARGRVEPLPEPVSE
jgi:hypothetical protein